MFFAKITLKIEVKATTAGPQQVYQHCYISLGELSFLVGGGSSVCDKV